MVRACLLVSELTIPSYSPLVHAILLDVHTSLIRIMELSACKVTMAIPYWCALTDAQEAVKETRQKKSGLPSHCKLNDEQSAIGCMYSRYPNSPHLKLPTSRSILDLHPAHRKKMKWG